MTEAKIDQLMQLMSNFQTRLDEKDRQNEETIAQIHTANAEKDRQAQEAVAQASKKFADLQHKMTLILNEKIEREERDSECMSTNSSDDSAVDNTAQNIASFRPRYNPTRPPTFSGEANEARPTAWRGLKIQMDIYFIELGRAGETLNDTRKIDLFLTNMTSPAVITASNIRSRDAGQTLNRFLEQLDGIYLKKSMENIYDRLFKLEQKIGQSTADYYEDFIMLHTELLNSASVPKEVSVNWFIKGLLDVLAEKVTYRRHADRVLDAFNDDQPEEAVERCFDIAAAEEAMLISSGRAFLLKKRSSNVVQPSKSISLTTNTGNTSVRSQWRSADPTPPNNLTVKADPIPLIQNKYRLTKDQVQSHWANQTCFSCNRTGHIAKYCRSKKPVINHIGVDSDSESDADDMGNNAVAPQSKK